MYIGAPAPVDACKTLIPNLQMAGEHLLLPLLRAVPQPAEPVGGVRPRVPRAHGTLPEAHQEPLQGHSTLENIVQLATGNSKFATSHVELQPQELHSV